MTINISEYKRKDGTTVKSHKRKDPDFPELKYNREDLDNVNFENDIPLEGNSSSSLLDQYRDAKKLHDSRSARAKTLYDAIQGDMSLSRWWTIIISILILTLLGTLGFRKIETIFKKQLGA